MADQFRDQINKARREGYSDDEIIDYLKNKDSRVSKALDAGYKPTEIAEYLAPPLSFSEEVVRKTGIAARGVSEALAPVTAGAVIGATAGGALGLPTGVGAPVGALVGGLAVPAADALTYAYNKITDSSVKLPSQAISEMIPGPRAESSAERVLQSSAGALSGTSASVGAGRGIVNAAKTAPGLRSSVAPQIAAVGKEASRAPIGQIVTAPVATAVGQGVTEMTDSPLAGLIAGTATSMAAGLRPTKREAVPSADELLAKSKANYALLDKSGFQLDSGQFKQHMASIPAKMRKEVGYVESVNPRVAGAIKELMTDAPKDVAEIGALRKIIGSAAQSTDASERKAALMLLDEFDNYVMNAPASAIVAGDRNAMDAWKLARADYAKVKKAELIQDIVNRAEVSQGGKEATVAQGLSSLAKNEKKMRFFSPDEQKAIREAAKGGTLQSMLRTVAKFTPMTPAAAIFTAVSPMGAYTAAAGMAAKELAANRRLRQVNKLSERMLAGREPLVLESAFTNQPVFVTKGLQNMMNPVAMENQNALAR